MRRILRLPSLEHLFFAQLVAIGVGTVFGLIEYIRLKRLTKSRVTWALLEALRLWGFVAVSEAAIWYALRDPQPLVWITCGVLAPIAASLVFNNLHVALHKTLIQGETV
jgi:hypothetical protein